MEPHFTLPLYGTAPNRKVTLIVAAAGFSFCLFAERKDAVIRVNRRTASPTSSPAESPSRQRQSFRKPYDRFGGFLSATVFAIVAKTRNIYSGLWYPIMVAAMSFAVGLIFCRRPRIGDIARM